MHGGPSALYQPSPLDRSIRLLKVGGPTQYGDRQVQVAATNGVRSYWPLSDGEGAGNSSAGTAAG